MIEFISYSGVAPNLCSGKLTLKINGVERTLTGCIRSRGHVWVDDQYNEHVEAGSWQVRVPPDLAEYASEIEECVNVNIPWGCCGGCV